MSARDPRERDLVKCEDMRLYAERAVQYMGSRSLEEFLAADMVQAAVVRCVEVVGEAARLVGQDTRRRSPDIPWETIVGTRHILAHHYGLVNMDKVYSIVTGHLPALLDRLRPLIRDLEREVGWTDRQE
jgi:uncharacterized protein with HEPN domain